MIDGNRVSDPLYAPVLARLEGIQSLMMAAHKSGRPLTNESKGNERESFLRDYLQAAFPSNIRFGSGDATDSYGNSTGQLDIVVESPFLFSLPLSQGSSRLYFAEGVVAVIEVKSNLSTQWREVISTAEKVKKLQKRYYRDELMDRSNAASLFAIAIPDPTIADLASSNRQLAEQLPKAAVEIPVIAVGFEGWKSTDAALKALQASNVDALLVLDSQFYVTKLFTQVLQATDQPAAMSGPTALLGFLELITHLVSREAFNVSPYCNYSIAPANRIIFPKEWTESLAAYGTNQGAPEKRAGEKQEG